MKKAMIAVTLVLALVAGACTQDVTGSDEYRALEQEVAGLEQQLADAAAQLVEARAGIEGSDELAATATVPAEVLVLLDEWWEANERHDGSVVELYTASGYHVYGTEKYSRDDLAAHLQLAGGPTWITEPYLIVAEPDGRYVVTRGMKAGSWASALTFEIVTDADGELKIAQTDWTYAH